MPGRRRKQQIPPSGLLSHKYSAARGRQGRAPMYTNEHYVYAQCGGPLRGEGGRAAQGCLSTAPFPWFLCLPGYPLQRVPCRLGDLASPGEGLPSPHCCPPREGPL